MYTKSKTTNNDSKRILYVINVSWFFLSHRRHIAQAAILAGYEVHVASAFTPHDAEILEADGIVCHQIPFVRSSKNPFHEFKTIWHLYRLFRKLKPDLTELATIKPVLYGCLVSRFLRDFKVVNWMTGLGYVFLSGGALGNCIRSVVVALYRFSFQRSFLKVIFENPDDLQFFVEQSIVNVKNAVLIRGAGVNLNNFAFKQEPPGPVVIILPARMLWDKGVEEFVEAAKLIKSSGVDARFLLVGSSDPDNPSSIPLTQLNQWHDDGTVEFMGFQDDMPYIYSKSHIVCLPSYREGLPKALLEAAACGKPIVTTDVPGCREIVLRGYNGFLVPAKNIQDLAEALSKLILSPDLRHKMGAHGRVLVEQNFSENQIVNETLSVYRGTLVPRKKLLFVVTEDWYFISHRLPIAREALRLGFEVLVATRVERFRAKIIHEGFKLIPLQLQRKSTNPLREISAIIDLIRIYHREQPDIVHHVSIKPVLYGAFAARLSGVPNVVNALTGMGFVFISSTLKARLLKFFVRPAFRLLLKPSNSILLLQNPDDCLMFTELELVSKDQIRLIRGSGVDTKKYHPLVEPHGLPVVILASRMLWDKGVGEFVEAAKLLQKRGVAARFILVGDSDCHNPAAISKEQLAAWHAQGTVEWWGHRDDMPEVLAQSHIACLPSYREGLPKSLLEAASCGLPIVTTNTNGCREVVRHGVNGFLVPIESTVELADALQLLIEDPELRRTMGAQSRKIAVNEFEVEKIVDETISIYEELVQL